MIELHEQARNQMLRSPSPGAADAEFYRVLIETARAIAATPVAYISPDT